MVLVVVNAPVPPTFLSERSLRLQVVQVVPVAIVSLGMAVVIGTRGIDISVGSVMAIVAATMAAYLGYGPIPAIVAGLIAGVLVGLINGSLVAFVRHPADRGHAGHAGGWSRHRARHRQRQADRDLRPDPHRLGTAPIPGIPVVVLIAAVLAVVVSIIVASTTFGRQVLATAATR